MTELGPTEAKASGSHYRDMAERPFNPHISFAEGIQMRLVQLQALTYKEFCVLIKREWLGTGVRLLLPALIMTFLLLVIIFQPSFATRTTNTLSS